MLKLLSISMFASLFLTSCMTTKREEEMNRTIQSLAQRVSELDSQLKDKSKNIDIVRSETQNATRSSQSTKSEIDEIKRDLALTQGSVDELRVKFGRIQEGSVAKDETAGGATAGGTKSVDVEENISGMGRRLAKLEAAVMAMEDKQKTDTNAKKNEKQTLKYKNVGELKSAVAAAFNKKEFKKVLTVANSVLTAAKIPKDQAEFALYIRGEAHFALQNYEEAAQDFTLYIDKYPKGDKVPRALLLSGDSYVYLKQSFTAKSYYADCVKAHPEKEECKASKDRLSKM